MFKTIAKCEIYYGYETQVSCELHSSSSNVYSIIPFSSQTHYFMHCIIIIFFSPQTKDKHCAKCENASNRNSEPKKEEGSKHSSMKSDIYGSIFKIELVCRMLNKQLLDLIWFESWSIYCVCLCVFWLLVSKRDTHNGTNTKSETAWNVHAHIRVQWIYNKNNVVHHHIRLFWENVRCQFFTIVHHCTCSQR